MKLSSFLFSHRNILTRTVLSTRLDLLNRSIFVKGSTDNVPRVKRLFKLNELVYAKNKQNTMAAEK